MSSLQPVLWNKGAFLQPQHLQAQDLYLENLLWFTVSALVTYPYGFRKLTLDSVALAGGDFGITEAAGVFKDGLPFDIGGSDPAPRPRALEGAFAEGENSLVVSLGVPQYRAGAINVAAGEGGGTRFFSDLLYMRDETSGLDEKPVQIARKNLVFLLPCDDQTGYSILPVARILRQGDLLEQDRTFVPPLLHIAASTWLTKILRDLTGILSAKSTEQARNRQGRITGTADVAGASDTAAFWLHYTVNQYAPVFRNLLNNAQSHPQEQFAEMLALAGALTAFTLKVDPADLPVYNHEDLGGCFTRLDVQLRDLLETAIPRYYLALPLTRTDRAHIGSVFIPDDRYLSDSRFYLGVKSESLNEIKVASAPQIGAIDGRAVSGVKLTLVPRLPERLPFQDGYRYYQMETSGDYWQGIRMTRRIAVSVVGVIPQPEMELFILLNNPV